MINDSISGYKYQYQAKNAMIQNHCYTNINMLLLNKYPKIATVIFLLKIHQIQNKK